MRPRGGTHRGDHHNNGITAVAFRFRAHSVACYRSDVVAPKRRPKRLALRTSVAVPCIGKHVDLLPDLLRHFERQTVRPDEIAFSISSCTQLSSVVAAALKKSPIPTIVKTDPGVAYAGKNRNRAAAATTGAIILYQDADDLPHPQRVELVKRAFEEHEIDHLIHLYTHATKPAGRYGPGVPGKLTDRYDEARFKRELAHQPAYAYSFKIHNGNIATTRQVFQAVKWDETMRRAQDVVYNKAVYRHFKQNAVLALPLVFYRQHLSSELRK